MAVRPIDAVQVLKDINRHHKPTPVSEFESGFNNGLNQAMWIITHAPTLTPPNEPLTWEGLKSEAKVNPVYSVKYGWIFPSTVKDEPYKQIWFFTSKGFAQTELFYRDTFYRRPPEGEEEPDGH